MAKLRSGLMMTTGSVERMFTCPLSAIFLAFAVVLLAWPFWSEWRQRRKGAEDGTGA